MQIYLHTKMLSMVTSSFTEISFTYQTVHLWEVYSSAGFPIFRDVQPSPHSALEHFCHLPESLTPNGSAPLPSTPTSTQGTPQSISVSIRLRILDSSYTEKYTSRGLWWLASFTWHDVFRAHPRCSIYQYLIPFTAE